MTKRNLLFAWAGMFILCAGLGFIPRTPGLFGDAVLIFLGIAFFLPPAVLLYRAKNEQDKAIFTLVRNLSAASLGLTLVLISVSMLTFAAPEAVGNILYAMLVMVSAPMMCCRFWVLSLFLWACLLLTAQNMLKRKK